MLRRFYIVFIHSFLVGKSLLQIVYYVDEPENPKHFCTKEHVRIQTHQGKDNLIMVLFVFLSEYLDCREATRPSKTILMIGATQ